MRTYDLSRLNVLTLDGSEYFLSIVRTMLCAFGVREVHAATRLTEGIEKLDKVEFDLALIDLIIGKNDGLDLVRTIRLNPDHPNRRIPFIVVTAVADSSRIQTALDAGVDYIVLKPLRSDVLYHRITSLVDAPQHYINTGSYFGPDRREVPIAPQMSAEAPRHQVWESTLPQGPDDRIAQL